ncbi:MAG: hypothetical protein AAB492_01300, partial [Patescibacteria group bacterium]
LPRSIIQTIVFTKGGLDNATGSLSDGFEKNGRGYRINLFPGFELDRALALLASTRQSQPFIKPLDSHSK